MFIEFFQNIYNHIWEFLAGLGLSTVVIYAMFRCVKGLIYVIFQKKKRELQKRADNEAVATLTTEKITTALQPKFDEIKADLDMLKEHLGVIDSKVSDTHSEQLEQMSIEVKAYQTAMLSQDNDIRLEYEQIKSKLIALSQQSKALIEDVATTTSTVANNLTEAVTSNEENIIKATEDVATTVKTVKDTAKKIKKKASQVVYE